MSQETSRRNFNGPAPTFNVGNQEIDGLVTIDQLGHREFVGGLWDEIGSKCGWEAKFIGDWNHPRNQQMIKYIAT